METSAAILSSGSAAGYLLAMRVLAIAVIIVMAGALMSKWEKCANQDTFSKINSRIFIPCMVFASMNRTPLDLSEVVLMSAASLLFAAASYPLARFWSSRYDGDRSAYVPMLFSSTSTMLLPLSFLLFGSQGIAKATFFHLANLLLLYTWGMKCSGQPSKFRDFFKTPTLHAVLLALLLKPIEVDLPVQISELLWLVEKGILMMAAGALPLLLMSHGYSICCLRSAGAGWWSPAALVRALWLPLVAVAMIMLLRYTGLAPMEKGYDLMQYLDLRTSEAILLMAASMPCTISLFRQPAGVPGSRHTDTLILSSTVISLLFLVVIVCMINRYIYSN